MNKKRIRQMDLALRRRLSDRSRRGLFCRERPAPRLETEGYMQRFAGLFSGARLRCADVLAPLPPGAGGCCAPANRPRAGWPMPTTSARRLLYPEETDAEPFAPGAVFPPSASTAGAGVRRRGGAAAPPPWPGPSIS